MAKCAGKSKAFTIRLFILLSLPALCAQIVPADALAAVDFPIFQLAGSRGIRPEGRQTSGPSFWLGPRLPGPDSMSAEDRTAVETLLLEAAGDGMDSMVAVGETIRNRSKNFRKQIPQVCLQPRQFSGWNDPDRASRFLRDHRRYYSRAWLAWKLSAWTALTAGATDYHTQDILPYWAEAYTPVARVGSHIFYIRQARRIRTEAGPVPA